MDDVFLNKKAVIERCLLRAMEEYGGNPSNLRILTHQDAAVLNLLRACEASIDLAMHFVSIRKLGIPKVTREAFQMLADAGILPPTVSDRMLKMVGFRNVAVHNYQVLDPVILTNILDERLEDFQDFLRSLEKNLPQ